MATFSLSEPLETLYARYYRGPSEWHRVSAADKAANVVALAGAVPHASLVEIGAGDGAVLERLAQLGFGRERFALEVSPAALDALARREIPGLVEARRFDGDAVPYADARFDVALLCHVLEHAEHPRRLLREAARVARHVVVEVPLEDTWRLPRDFALDAVGHINFFTPRSLRHLVQSCGLRVLAERVTNPSLGTYLHRLGAGGRWRWAAKELALRAAPRLATRLATYHGSLLCARA